MLTGAQSDDSEEQKEKESSSIQHRSARRASLQRDGYKESLKSEAAVVAMRFQFRLKLDKNSSNFATRFCVNWKVTLRIFIHLRKKKKFKQKL